MSPVTNFSAMSESSRRTLVPGLAPRWWEYPAALVVCGAVLILLGVCRVIEWFEDARRRWTAPPVVRYCDRCQNTGWVRASVRSNVEMPMGGEVCDHGHQ